MRARTLAAALALCVVIGCSRPANPDLKPVSGTVRWQGRPLEQALVRFIPVGTTGGGGGAGVTDANGAYTVTDARGGKGLLPGEYKVVVSKRSTDKGAAAKGGDIDNPAKELLPARYSHANDTELTARVGADGRPIDFELP